VLGRLRRAARPERPSLHLRCGLQPASACCSAVFVAVRRPRRGVVSSAAAAKCRGLSAALGRLRHAAKLMRPSLHLSRGLQPTSASRSAVFAAARRPRCGSLTTAEDIYIYIYIHIICL